MTLKIDNMNEEEKEEMIKKVVEIKGKLESFNCLVNKDVEDEFKRFIQAKGFTLRRGLRHAEGYIQYGVFL